MAKRNFFSSLLLIIFLFTNTSILLGRVVDGNCKPRNPKSGNCKDEKKETKNLSFPIASYAFSTRYNTYDDFSLFVTSNAINSGEFSIARATRNSANEKNKSKAGFMPLCPQKIMFNNQAFHINPLYNQKIPLIKLLSNLAVVVKENDNKLYLLLSTDDPKKGELYSSVKINDSLKKPAAEIISLAVAEQGFIQGSWFLAAVKNNGNEKFGSEGSGIAMIYLTNKQIMEKKENIDYLTEKPRLIVLNADPKDKLKLEDKNKEDKSKKKSESDSDDETKNAPKVPSEDNKAFPITGKMNEIKIGHEAFIDNNIVDMHWDRILGRLYVAFSVKSNSQSGSGARAILVGRISRHKLIFEPIAPDSAFTSNDQIVGTGIANDNVSIYKVRTMRTSTLLNYLIVAGGNGTLEAVGNKIFALPLVNENHYLKKVSEMSTTQGTLAKYDQNPKEFFNENEYLLDKGREFVLPAKINSDLLTDKDKAAIVGNGDLPLNPNEKISDLFTINDAVFVCISNDYKNKTQPGIYSSQAIFDEYGKITAWTKWQRVVTDKKVLGAECDIPTGQFWYIAPNENGTAVELSEWGKYQHNPNALLNKEKNAMGLFDSLHSNFGINNDGIHQIFDFSRFTPGFNNFSMLIATGFCKIALIETGSLKGSHYKPTKDDLRPLFDSNVGNLPIFNDHAKFVTIHGGHLAKIGSIVAADIVSNFKTNEHWIVVGGVGGIAILMNNQGKCWRGDISLLNQIPSGSGFKKVGNYSFVRKIQSDGEFLYVLTDKKLDRIKISSADFKTNNLKITTLADVNDQSFKNIYLTDFGISNKFGILATSCGLYRVGDYKDIRYAKNFSDVNWTKVNVPDSYEYILKLFFVTPTGNSIDYADQGQVYVLSSNRELNRSKLNRFFVKLQEEINNETIKPLPDMYFKDKHSCFFEFASYKDFFWTDGAQFLSLQNKDTNQKISLETLVSYVYSGLLSSTVKQLPLFLDIKSKEAYQINKITRNSASGELLVNGNFGLRINQ